MVGGEHDRGIAQLPVLKQRLKDAVEAVIDMADLGVVGPPRIVALRRIRRDRAVQPPHRQAVRRPVPHYRVRQRLGHVAVHKRFRRVQRGVRPVVGEHQEERFGRVAAAQKVDAHRRDPTGRVKHLLVHPGPRRVAIAAHAGIDVVRVRAKPLSQPRRVVVNQPVVVPFGTLAVQVAVVQEDVVEAHQIARGMRVHLADTLCMVARVGQQPGHCAVVMPVDLVVIADKSGMPLVQAGEDRRPRRHAGGRRRIGLREVDALTGQSVQVGRLRDGMPRQTERVGPPLVYADEKNVGPAVCWHGSSPRIDGD